jgi:hypothetical protein
MGGTAEGITSGLSRQGYKERPGRVLPEDLAKMKMSDIGGMDIGQLQKLSRSMSYKPQKKYGSDFLVDFGLNLASTPPAGNILSTAALAAKDPFSRYTGAKKEDELSQYASESDMFTTMLGAQADVLAAERGEGMAGKTEQWKFEQVPKLINTISELESIPVDERTTEQQNDLDTAKINLGRLEKEDPFVGWFLQSDQSDKLYKKVKTELFTTDQQSDEPKYSGEEDPQLWEDTYVEFRKRVKRMGKAEGGRIGYADAGAVMPGQPMQAQAAGPTDQGPVPADMGAVSYEELRARLPQEVGDDIVRLLANSAEALEDFAMIQTEQDINTFNKKYGVNLVLPSEG